MRNETIIDSLAIITITIITLYGLFLGYNHVLIGIATALIGAIAGYQAKKFVDKLFK